MSHQQSSISIDVDEAFDFAAVHGAKCCSVFPKAFEADPIRTTALLGVAVAGWSILFDRAMKIEALQYSYGQEKQAV